MYHSVNERLAEHNLRLGYDSIISHQSYETTISNTVVNTATQKMKS